ncbi:MAG: helicase-exonuclease AddAB subunit AddA [Lactobacillales bacterium]|jgi:ATP-dependent helicase/nuclease subunit A|nr:helicase-exonuclease AddAB subunit AddA [Lactobacillales bacterium]
MIPVYQKERTHFSEVQWQAIYESGQNILVSASAGSGKTSVLVERVIQKVMQGTGVNELLIVTFTEAAASQMKSRIKVAIEKKLREDDLTLEMKIHFSKQLQELPLANISTFHAFCLTVIHRFFHLVPMDPSFRLQTDETGIELAKEEVWNRLSERLLEGEDTENFQSLISNFSTDKSDEGLRDIVFQLYEFARVDSNPRVWIQSLSKIYKMEGDPVSSPIYQKLMKPFLLAKLERSCFEFQLLFENAECTRNLKLIQMCEEKLQWVRRAAHFLEENKLEEWDEALRMVKFSAFRFSKKEENYEEVMALKSSWESAKENLKKIANYENYLGRDSYHWRILKQSEGLVSYLASVTLHFYQGYQQQKEEDHLLDFSDLEHFALKILNTKNDENLWEAQDYYQKRFSEVLIDEYQDVNRLQVEILSKVSRNDNQFMVGDVKQSIYGFRLADPTLFMECFDKFQNQDVGRLLVLAENYRSREEIIHFINLVFSQLMDKEMGQVSYSREVELVAGAKFPESENFHPEILLYEQGDSVVFDENEGADFKRDQTKKEVEEDLEIDSKIGSVEGEICLTAQKISELIDSSFEIWDGKKKGFRPVTYGDIVILTSTKSENKKIQEILTHYGIANHVTDANTYFQTTEIQTMMSLLQIIDNPYQDIPLASVLRSPIVGLSEIELAEIRLQDKQGYFYEAVKRKAKTDSKIASFLEQLDQWRMMARKTSLAELIWDIYSTSAYLDFVGAQRNGRQRQDNLHALAQRAAQFEENGARGLFQFVRFIQKMQEKKKDLAEPVFATNENVVEIMTIHKSKGLEFPIVFLIHLSKKFNLRDLSSDTVMDEHLGLGICYLDLETCFQYESLPFLMMKQIKQEKLLSEEYRKFYVAMTRAEQKLFLVGSLKNWENSLAKWTSCASSKEIVLSKEMRLKTQNFMDLLMMTLIRHRNGEWLASEREAAEVSKIKFHPANFKITNVNSVQLYEKELKLKARDVDQLNIGEEKIQDYAEEIRIAKRRLEFCYPHVAATQTASYQSVSEMKQVFGVPDQVLKLASKKSSSNRYVRRGLATPQFLESSSIQKITPAMVGTATHLLLQTVDLAVQPTGEIFINLLQHFVKEGVLTKQVAEKVEIAKVVSFFETEFGQLLLRHHENVYREEAFSMLISPSKIYTNYSDASDDKVLVHGIVDGYIDFGEDVLLFDYKTDRLSSVPMKEELEEVKNRYQGQILLYRLALEKALRKRVSSAKLILLSANFVVEMQDSSLL